MTTKKKQEENGHPQYLSAYDDIADDVGDLDDKALRCGYCSWKPDWLQGCNSPRMLLACICWFTFTQGQSKMLVCVKLRKVLEHNYMYLYRQKKALEGLHQEACAVL